MRGAESKETILKILKKLFPGAFCVGKDLRIPVREDGEIVEVKVALTAAKDVLGGAPEENMNDPIAAGAEVTEMTDEEKAQVVELLKKLGFEVK